MLEWFPQHWRFREHVCVCEFFFYRVCARIFGQLPVGLSCNSCNRGCGLFIFLFLLGFVSVPFLCKFVFILFSCCLFQESRVGAGSRVFFLIKLFKLSAFLLVIDKYWVLLKFFTPTHFASTCIPTHPLRPSSPIPPPSTSHYSWTVSFWFPMRAGWIGNNIN